MGAIRFIAKRLERAIYNCVDIEYDNDKIAKSPVPHLSHSLLKAKFRAWNALLRLLSA